jgi:hypothetical protein
MAINVNIPNSAPKYLRDIVNAIDELKKVTWQGTTKQTSRDYEGTVGTIKHIKYGTDDYRLRIKTEDGYVETLKGTVAKDTSEYVITNSTLGKQLGKVTGEIEDQMGNLSDGISLLESQIFTDANGKINKTPNPLSSGLYLGSTHLGYWTGSQWRTYMNNNGGFFLDGTNGYLAWNPVTDTLNLKGNIYINNPGNIRISDLDNDANFVKTFYQSSAPTSGMSTGDLWYDTDDKQIYRYTSGSWVSLLTQGVRTFYQTTAPASGMITGDVWYDTDDKTMYRFNGSTWDVLVNRTLITDAGIYSGTINAAQVNAGELNGFTMTIGSGTSIYKADTNGIYLGNSTFASAPFRVTPAGALTATNATITGSITLTNTIPNDKVSGLGTLALKSSLLGSDGVTTVITASGIQTGSIKAGDIAANAITADKINASAVTTDKLNALAVTTDKLATGAITADKIFAGSITSDKLSVSTLSAISTNLGTVTAGSIDASDVNIINLHANNIVSGTLSAARIAAGSITTDKLNVTSLSSISANLGTITAGNITGVNITGATITGGIYRSSTSGDRIEITSGGISLFSATGNRGTISYSPNSINSLQINSENEIELIPNGQVYVGGSLYADSYLQAYGYKSYDGSIGGTSTTGGVTFKNGLYISGSLSGSGTVTSVAISAPSAITISGSPITTSGTITLGLASGYTIPTTTQASNWTTAYNWGNHASAGYHTGTLAIGSGGTGATTASVARTNLGLGTMATQNTGAGVTFGFIADLRFNGGTLQQRSVMPVFANGILTGYSIQSPEWQNVI